MVGVLRAGGGGPVAALVDSVSARDAKEAELLAKLQRAAIVLDDATGRLQEAQRVEALARRDMNDAIAAYSAHGMDLCAVGHHDWRTMANGTRVLCNSCGIDRVPLAPTPLRLWFNHVTADLRPIWRESFLWPRNDWENDVTYGSKWQR